MWTGSERYAISKEISFSHGEAVERARELLHEEGYGVLAEIGIQAKLKEKLGVDMGPYTILGACNPPLASKALAAEPELGTLLPCNFARGRRRGRHLCCTYPTRSASRDEPALSSGGSHQTCFKVGQIREKYLAARLYVHSLTRVRECRRTCPRTPSSRRRSLAASGRTSVALPGAGKRIAS